MSSSQTELGVNLKDKFIDFVRLRPHQLGGMMQRLYPFLHPISNIQVRLAFWQPDGFSLRRRYTGQASLASGGAPSETTPE
jgi:hypothetical protein